MTLYYEDRAIQRHPMPMTEQPHDDSSVIARQRDRLLVRRLLAGDQRAFEEFVRLYFGCLYRFALYRLGSPQAVDEVVQTVLETAARRLETWRGEATLYTWLLQICRHEISHFRQRASRDRELMTPFLNDEVLRAAVENITSLPADDPESAVQRMQLLAQIGRALDQLPEHQAQALEMKYIDGDSSQQIAAQLGIGDAATQSLLARARRGFRAAFSAETKIPANSVRTLQTASTRRDGGNE
jgi:RNA polymerase sigma-70 factor (ECF subfamily)